MARTDRDGRRNRRPARMHREAPRRRPRRPDLEAMEDRTLLSISVADVSIIEGNPGPIVLSGTLDPGNEADVFRIRGRAGQRLFVDATSFSSNNGSWNLYDPYSRNVNGTTLGTDFKADLALDGIYTLVLDGNAAPNAPISYTFQVADASDAPVTNTGFGVTQSGTIAAGQVATFNFNASAGTIILFDSLDQDNDPISFHLRDPSNALVWSQSASSDTTPRVLSRSGTYTLSVAGNFAGATGDYKFRVLDLAANSTPLTLGAVTSGTLPETSTQVFRVDLAPGQRVFYDALDGDFDAVFAHMYGPGAVPIGLGGGFYSDYDSSQINIAVGGTYYLYQASNVTSGTPDYSFRLLDATRPPAQALTLGAATSGTLDPGTEMDLYRVSLTAGQRLYLDWGALGTGSASWRLYKPDGSTVSGASSSVGSDGLFTAPLTGEYVLEVAGHYGNTAPYAYGFRLLDLGVHSTALTFGTAYSGTLTTDGVAIYRFAGTAGQRLHYDALDVDFDSVSAVLYEPDGSTVGVNQNASYDTNPFFLDQTGTHYLVLRSNSGALDYGFRLLDAGAAPAVTLGTERTGTLNPGQATDLYRITATAGQRLYIDFTSASATSGTWYVHRPDTAGTVAGTSIGFDDEFVAPISGTYVLAVYGDSASTLDYKFRVLEVGVAGTPLTMGTTYSGTLTGRSAAVYTFTGTAGQRLLYDAHDRDNDSVNATLYTPSGSIEGLNTNADSDSNPFSLTQTGTYTLVINSTVTSGNPDYQFRLLDTGAAPLVTLGTPRAGTLTPGEATDVYRITGAAGQRLYIDFQNASSTSASWYLYRPDSSYVASGNVTGDDIVTLPVAGTYVLAVFGDQVAPISYAFQVNDLATAPATLTLGAEVSQTLPAYQSAYYAFDGTAGQRLFYDAIEDDTENVRFQLYDPDNSFIHNLSYNDSDPFTLTKSGRYLVVMANQTNATADFRFRLIDTAAAPAQTLALNTPVSNTLNPGDLTAVYRFNGTAGQSIYVDFTAGTGGNWYLYRPDNGYVGGSSLGNDNEFDLTQTGQYLLVVLGNTAAATSYTFQVNGFTQAATPLTLGTVVDSTLSVPGEQDVYTVTLAAGQRLYFDGQAGPASGTINARLLSPEDGSVFSSNVLNDTLPFTIVRPGAYRLVIDGNGVTTGNYRFLLSDVTAAPTQALTFGTNYSGTLTPGEATQLYRISAVGGTSLSINTSGSGGDWRLYGPGNDQVGGTSLPNDLTVFVPTTGTYVLAVRGNSTAPANYTLQVNEITPASTALSGWNTTQSGSLAASAFQDFVFTAPAGRMVYFDSLDRDNDSAVLTLRDPDNQIIHLSGNSASFDYGPYILAKSGTYTLRVANASATATADYKFRFLDLATAATAYTLGADTTGDLPEYEADVYSFSGVAGQRLIYDGIDADNDAVSVRLFRADDTQEMSQNSDSDSNPFFIETAGVRYLIVSNDSVAATPDYRFALIDFAQAPTTVLPLDGTAVTGTVDPGRSMDAFRFDGAAGQFLLFDFTSTGTDATWRLYGPNNQNLASWNPSTTDRMLQLPVSGSYVLTIDGEAATAQPYSFRVLQPSAGTALTFGTTYTDTVAAQSSKLYRFTGAVGQRLLYDALDNDSDNVTVSLYDPDGGIVHINGNSDNDVFPFTLTKAGTYTLVQRVTDGTARDHRFRLLDAGQAPAQALTLGTTPISVTIDPGREIEVFRFNGTAGQAIYIDMLGGTGSVSWSLYRPNNNHETSGNITSDVFDVLQATGEYLLVFDGNSATPVTFSFRVLDLATQATTLNIGTLTSGTLPNGSAAIYKFNGTAGQVLLYDGQDTDADAVNFQIYRADGSHVTGTNADYDTDPFRLPVTGVYYLWVSSTAAGTPDFAFRLVDASSPSVAITPETPVSGTLNPGNAAQVYTFTATAGQRLFIDFTSAATGAASWYLYRPDLGYVTSAGSLGSDREVDLTQSGTYTLVLYGNYNVTAPTPYSFVLYNANTSATPYVLGTVQAGSIDEPGERDTYTFTGTAGQRLYFDGLGDSSASNALYAQLYDPEGSSTVLNAYLDNNDGPVTLTKSGTYTLRVYGNNPSDVTGSYSFRLSDIAQATALTEGVAYSGNLDPGRSTLLFRFDAAAGERFYFDSLLASSEFDGYWQLHRPSGGAIVGNYFSSDNQVLLDETGTYLLVLEGSDATSTVPYNFRVHLSPDVSTPLTLGATTLGTIGEPGERDTYTFTGHAGQQLFLDGLAGPASGPVFVRLYEPDGTYVGLGQTLPNDDTPVTLNHAGTYRLVVEPAGATTGDYSFRLLDLSAQPYQSLDATIAEVTVTLSAPSATPVTVNYATANGTASSAAGDYTPTSGTLTFAPGETTKVIPVVITRDLAPEANETVLVNLSSPVGDTIADAQGVVTILNDDGPSVFVDNPLVVEGNSGTATLTFTISLSATSSVATSVNWATANGTATAGTDYVAASGTVTFAPGETTKTVSVTVNGDTTAEPDETVFLNLSGVVAAVILDPQGVGTIRNDDTAVVASSPAVAEGNSGTTALVFTVSLTQPVVQTVTVNYATANGTAMAGTDYVAASGTVTFAPGETTKTVSVTVNGDATLEPNETVLLNLSGAVGGSILTPQAVGTILNDDSELAINDASIVEGDAGTKTMTFTVTLSPASGSAVSVNWATASGTATAGSDFVAASGTLNFAPGETSKTVSVTINGDTNPEAFETFTVVLTGGVNATVGDGTGVGTIQNDDAAFAVDDAQVLEGQSGTTALVVPVRLLFPVVTAVSVQAATADGSAAAPGDYAALAPTTVTFAPGETLKGVTVNVVGDGAPEPNETFFVNLLSPSAGVIDDAQAIATIRNDDTTVAIADVAVVEGNSGTTTMNFVVSLTVPSAVAVTVNYTTADGSATVADGDYVAASGTLTFNPGETTKTIAITINGDATPEAYESLLLNLSAASNAVIVDPQAVGTIRNDDAALVIDSRTQIEGNSGTTPFTFTVSFAYPVAQTVTVDVATAGGTAVAPADYAALTTTLTFSPGETAKSVTVNVVGEALAEADETFTVNLSGATGATIATATGVGTIRNDDTSVSVAGATVTEGNAGTVTLAFPVTLSVPSAQTVTVEYFTANGTAVAPGDYATAVGTLTFAPGETTKTVSVAVNGDALDEFDETLTLNLTNAVNAVLGTASATGTITDDDAAALASIADASVAEGNSGTATLVFTVSLNTASGKPVSVDWSTANGTATAGVDYVAASGTLGFAPGETSKTVSVAVNGDTIDEPDETLLVNLSNATNATLADGQAVGTILDDDAGAGLSIADASVAEGNSGTATLVFTVTLGTPSGQAVTVDWSTADGSATVAGADYIASSGTLTFAPGETSKTVSVAVNGDALDEFDETILVNLSNAVNAALGDAQAIGTILDDDAAVSAALGDATVIEGHSGTVTATFTVSLGAASGKPITIDWSTAGGTATPGADYVAASGTLSFAPGETTKAIAITVNGDTLDEFDETFLVNLTGATNAGLIDAQGVGMIQDDDAPVAISAANASVAEGNSGTATLVFTVSLNTASGKPVSVDWSTADGTAVAPGDYVAASGTLTFAPGETTRTVSVTVNGDALDEFDETFALNLSNAGNATIGAGTATGTITDDDAPVSASVGDAGVVEGNAGTVTATFTVSLSGPSGKPVTIDWSTADGTAVAPGDYVAASGTLTFAPGETTRTVSVTVNGDTLVEGNETYVLKLSNPGNATIADGQAVGLIVDDDAVTNSPPVAVGDTAATTDQAPVTVNVLANDTDADLPNDTLTVIAVGSPPAGTGSVTFDGTSVTYTPAPNTNGPVTFSYTIRDAAGLQSTANVVVNVNDVTRPRVLDLRVVAGSNSISILNTTRTLPWINVQALEVVFSEGVGVDQADMVLTGVNQASYPFSGMTYDGPNRTARWSLPSALGVDQLLLALDGDAATGGVVDGAGNGLLNGDLLRTLRVLPGDFDNDGVVTINDVVGIRNSMPQYNGTYSVWADLDADGDVDVNDLNQARARLGRRLP